MERVSGTQWGYLNKVCPLVNFQSCNQIIIYIIGIPGDFSITKFPLFLEDFGHV